MEIIIEKYKDKSKNRYIFPIMNDEKECKYKIRDYLYKKFRKKTRQLHQNVNNLTINTCLFCILPNIVKLNTDYQ